MHQALRQQVLEASLDLAARGLAHANFGNVSGIDRDAAVIAIKPSGVSYAELKLDDVSIVALDSGERLAGLQPSSDTPTHLELYRAFERIGGVVHTHSTYATSWAQARLPIPCLGTTHADYLNGPVPITRTLTDEECGEDYERVTGTVILEALAGRDPFEVPAALVASHGPFAWADSPAEAVEHAAALEEIAHVALNSLLLAVNLEPISDALRERHYRRKHGPTAYYGQR